MNATQYAEFLLSAYRQTDGEKDIIANKSQAWADARSKQFGSEDYKKFYEQVLSGQDVGLPKDLSEGIPKDIRDWETWYFRKMIYTPILNAAPKQIRDSVANVPIITLPIRAFNAHIIKAPTDGAVIVISSGLMTMAQHYMEMNATLGVVNQQYGSQASERYLVTGYLFIISYFSEAGQMEYPFPKIQVPEELLQMAMICTMAIEAFAVCHELGHFYLKHLDSTPTKNLNLTATKKEVAPEFYQLSWEHEYAADRFAWDLLSQIFGAIFGLKGTLDDSHVMSLYLFVLLTIVEKNIENPDMYATHPPALERLAKLILHMSQTGVKQSVLESAIGIFRMAESVPGPKRLKEYFDELLGKK
jgi:hypothetical protein